MIKINKPKRFTNICKISSEAINGGNFSKHITKELKRIKRVPKNTLKVKFIDCVVSYSGDDFMRGLMTMRAQFDIITFRRK